jgi:hypothetical protein
MARKPRVHFAGARYHVMSRGNQGQSIFRDDRDRERDLEFLKESQARFGHRLYACKTWGQVLNRESRAWSNPYQPVMRPHLAVPEEKEAAQGYTSAGPGETEVERPWGVQPVYQPDPRAVCRHHPMLPPER